jgi:hypothetical protein
MMRGGGEGREDLSRDWTRVRAFFAKVRKKASRWTVREESAIFFDGI